MIYTLRTVQIAQGKRAEALEFAQRHTKWAREKYAKRNPRLLEDVLGDHTVLHWLLEFESLAAWEAHRDAINADKEYEAFMAESRKKLLFTVDRSVTRGFRVLVG
jgi:hypothetical protein